MITITPRITEKSAVMTESKNVYTFNVPKEATKKMVSYLVKKTYKVTPTKVHIVNNILKKEKKALVFLKKGDKIEFA